LLAAGRRDEEALEKLEEAEYAAQAALAAGLEESETYRILSEAIQRQIRYRDAAFAQEAGPRASDAIQRALKHDPANGRAHFALGTSLLYTPRQFGGDPIVAAERFKRADELLSDPLERYLARLFAGRALQKAGRIDEARTAYLGALAVLPDGRQAEEALERLPRCTG
jgi:tetratricopeptide (TPR) repeat protein